MRVELVPGRSSLGQDPANEDESSEMEEEVVDLGAEENGPVALEARAAGYHAASSKVATASLPIVSTSAGRGCGSTKTAATSAPTTARAVRT